MSIRNTYPTIRPSLNLNFARSRTLDPRITFTRTTTGTYMDSDGLIKTAIADQPRFDHRYVNGQIESLGLLVEEGRSNLLLRSEDFTTTWTNFNSTDASNTAIAPDGNTTADTLISNVGVTDGLLRQDVSGLVDNTTYTFSIFLKTAGLVSVSLQFYNKANTFHGSKTLNLSTGILSGSDFVGTSSVVSYGNGWYRLVLSNLGSGTGATTPNVRIIALSTGDGTSGIYVWGAQLEQGAFPTSYIPTSGGTGTRTLDNVSMEGTNFTDWYNQSEGSILWIGNVYTREVIAVCPYKITQGSNLRGIGVQFDTRSGLYNTYFMSRAVASNFPTETAPSGTIPSENKIKIAGSYEEGVGISAAFNGQEPASSSGTSQTDIVFGSENQMDIGGSRSLSGSNNKFSGVCERLVYYPRRLTNAQLQNLTK